MSSFHVQIIEEGGDYFVRNQVCLKVVGFNHREERFGTWRVVNREVLGDRVMYEAIINSMKSDLKRMIEPWTVCDKPWIIWRFDPFPRWTKVVLRYKAWRSRSRD